MKRRSDHTLRNAFDKLYNLTTIDGFLYCDLLYISSILLESHLLFHVLCLGGKTILTGAL